MIQILLVALAQAEYLPGTKQRSYKLQEDLLVLVDGLKSEHTQIPFEYYYLKFCRPSKLTEMDESFGQVLVGDIIENTPYSIKMNENISCQVLCNQTLTDDERENFRWMIDASYYSNWILDSLPAGERISRHDDQINYHSYRSGIPIGFKSKDKYLIINHLQFIIKIHPDGKPEPGQSWNPSYKVVGFLIQPFSFSENQHCPSHMRSEIEMSSSYDEEILHSNEVIPLDYNVNPVSPQELSSKVYFTYSVRFEESLVPWSSRWDSYLYREKGEVHWISILNSFGVVILLSFIIIHLFRKNVNKDISSYNENIDKDPDVDSGWKQLRGDVFRPPGYNSIFCAFIGTGVQIILMTFFTLTFASFGFLRPEHRGSLIKIMIFLFAFMGIFAGYVSGRLYKTLNGERWKVNSLTVSLLFPGVCFSIFFVINFLIWEESAGAVSFSSLAKLLCIWFVVSLPLTLMGSGLGFKKSRFTTPCRISKIPKPIPFRSNKLVYFVCGLAGTLPFGCMFIEMNYIMNSIWHISLFYYLFGFLLLSFLVLSLTSAEVSILMTYLVLNREDYRWWWLSFCVPALSGVYLFVYSVFYYLFSLEIVLVSSTVLYFGYMFLASVAYCFMTGTVGFISSYLFVRKIYSMIKAE